MVCDKARDMLRSLNMSTPVAARPLFSCLDTLCHCAGGGSVTFGAPMTLYATNAAVLYQQLAAFEEAAEATYAGQAKLQFHNFVNNADIVPRLLGTSLDTVHDAVEGYIPSMKVCWTSC